MGWTKRQFVIQAFEEIGYASYIYDAMPEQLQSVLRTLDTMLATWNAKGIRIGYPLPSSPDSSNLEEETNVPDSANSAIYYNLAVWIAPRFGKTVQAETKAAAKEGYLALLSKAVMPREKQLPKETPLGAGNKPWRRTNQPFVKTPTEGVLAGNDSEITFE